MSDEIVTALEPADLDRLEQLALDENRDWNTPNWQETDEAYEAALDPSTVLELIRLARSALHAQTDEAIERGAEAACATDYPDGFVTPALMDDYRDYSRAAITAAFKEKPVCQACRFVGLDSCDEYCGVDR